ncbi:D-threonate kinase [Klebsiella quasivariicola]|uniref:D-threonate kinase n=1 Tax=Klebsiella quasivariicola TaxID=2026240 RepID=UPI0009BBB403|nr:four-carbon acid sugar kinase family protein [Klebsiella quasivariicola]SLY37621.1 inner membrane protein [Klebsiella quasivariicola]
MNDDGNNNVLVLADDFTGANDAGVSLAEAGMAVEVAFTAGQASSVRALILNSDSRAMSAAAAADKVTALLRGAATFTAHWQVKKIDSTLRGNPGAELEAMMTVQNCRVAVVAPAYPAAGRHTRDGRCYVRGVALDQTEFASDPKTPVSRADIAGILAMQSRLPCRSLSAAQLPAALAAADEERRVLIVDAWEDGHLDQVIDAVAPHVRKTLLVGSAGLCEALARRLRRSEQGPLLAVVGSMSEMAQRQVAALQAHPRVRQIEIDVARVFSGSPEDEARRIAGVLREGRHCVVTTRPDSAARQGIEARCREQGLSRAAYGERICGWLAALTAQAVAQCPPGALYLSGGDVAIAVAQALGASGFQIRGRVAECVPYGHFLGGRWSRPVMTKAGGFGTDTTLLHVVNFIEEKLSV